MTAHVHAELIKQWADDTSRVVQHRAGNGDWHNSGTCPSWAPNTEYRFTPEPPVQLYKTWKAELTEVRMGEHWELDNLRLTFEDGKLIKAEVI